MSAETEVKLPILDTEGQERGELWVYLLPGREPHTLLDLRNDPDRTPVLEPVQLMEAQEYRYEFVLPGLPDSVRVKAEPAEVFEPDTLDGRRGRLHTRLYTGMLHVRVLAPTAELGATAFEVRSRKLEYLQHYQWMLQDIAETLTEAVMERFAPTEQRFTLDERKDASSLYQRFAFIKSLISGVTFETAMHQILDRPHRGWVEDEEVRPPGRGISGSSAAARQIAVSGPRVQWMGGPIEYLPAQLRVRRTEETLDTAENRFLRFVLTNWRDLSAEIGRILAKEPETSPAARGRREVAAVIERLDELLSANIFHEVGRMMQFPFGSQVLQKRAGYREIFKAYVQFEAAAAIDWEGGEDVYSAGQRNVAALYEYWVFLQLVKRVGAMCNEGFSEESLFRLRPDGLGFTLKQGRQRLVTGVASRHGRQMRLELWYNRSFGQGNGPSWTMPMRPDCSVRIRPEKGSSAEFEEVWLHFDAKYRIEALKEIFGTEPDPSLDEAEYLAQIQQAEDTGRAKRDDLLKMHAYRDAIHRSAGAYVIYPGAGGQQSFQMYHELLPGLGAFALRPADGGDAEGTQALERFLEDVLDHVASQATQHERERWWVREAHADRYLVAEPVSAAPFLTRPPADTGVLLGYVKSHKHLEWIHSQGLYNLRADDRNGSVLLDSRELAAEIVVLYNPTLDVLEFWRVDGVPVLSSRTEMHRRGYPEPRGDLYYCLKLQPISRKDWPIGLTVDRVEAVRKGTRVNLSPGEPVAISWLDLVRT